MNFTSNTMFKVPTIPISMVIAAIIRIGFLVLLPFLTLDARFIPDDTYYTLTIAKNISEGVGPSAGGGVLTNGFQALLAFLEAPAFWFLSDPIRGVYYAIGLGVIADIIAVGLIGYITSSVSGQTAGRWAALMWACSTLAVNNALGGLEASISLAIGLGVLLQWLRYTRMRTMKNAVAFGIMGGLAILSRVDLAFLLVPLAVAAINERVPIKHAIFTLAFSLIVVAPWWIYQLSTFGTIVPESGAAVVDQAKLHLQMGVTRPQIAGWAIGQVLGGGVSDFPEIRSWLFMRMNWPTTIVFITMLASLVVALLANYRTRAAGLWGVFALLGFLFYVFHVSALWFFARYMYPLQAFAVISLAIAAGSSTRIKRTAVTACVVLCGISLWTMSGWVIAPDRSLAYGYDGIKGYYEPTALLVKSLPEGATVCGFQTGATGYHVSFDDRNIRAINADGVVNRYAHAAIRNRRLSDYLRKEQCTHYADWPLNEMALRYFSSRSEGLPFDMKIIGEFNQRQEIFYLWHMQ